MKIFTVGLLLVCVLFILEHLQGASGFRRGGYRAPVRYRAPSVRRTTGGSGGSFRPSRIVPPLLLSSSRRRRSGSSSILRRQQCQRCTTAYIYRDSRTSNYMTRTYPSSGAQEVSICRAGTAACNYGKCSINYLWSNRTITDFPDGVGGIDPEVGGISDKVESVLICGTLRHAPTLQVTILALVMVAVMRMVGGA